MHRTDFVPSTTVALARTALDVDQHPITDGEGCNALIDQRRRGRSRYIPRLFFLLSFFLPPDILSFTMLRRAATTIPRRVAAARSANSYVRNLSISAQRMNVLKPLEHPLSATLPSDSFQLLPESQKAGAAEDALYNQQIKDVEAWWASPRYEGIKRPYSAADVVSKRGSQLQSYPSSVMARKLFNLIKEREAKGEPIHTSKSYDVVQNAYL